MRKRLLKKRRNALHRVIDVEARHVNAQRVIGPVYVRRFWREILRRGRR